MPLCHLRTRWGVYPRRRPPHQKSSCLPASCLCDPLYGILSWEVPLNSTWAICKVVVSRWGKHHFPLCLNRNCDSNLWVHGVIPGHPGWHRDLTTSASQCVRLEEYGTTSSWLFSSFSPFFLLFCCVFKSIYLQVFVFYLLEYCGNKNLWKAKLVVTGKHSLIMTFYILKSRTYKLVSA